MYGKEMPLIYKCIAQLTACFGRVGEHIFRVWNIADERLQSIVFKILRQVIYILKMEIEGLLADVGFLGEFLYRYLFNRFYCTQFYKCTE